MQKAVAIVALLSVLALAVRVEAFGVYVDSIAIHTTKEYGGVPEIRLICTGGTPNYIFRTLDFVNVANQVYQIDTSKSSAILDSYLGVHEKHTCRLYESDSSSRDYDREDNSDDTLGYFTISRADFRNSRIMVKRLNGAFGVALGCYNC